MPRAEQRRFDDRIQVNPLGQTNIGMAANTVQALGDLRGNDIVFSRSDGAADQDAMAFSFLSRSLAEAQRAAEGVVQQRQEYGKVQGAKAYAEGAKYEDMKKRGMQDGYLAAKGMDVAEKLRRDLLMKVETGEITPEQARESVKEQLKGLQNSDEEAPFIASAMPRIVQGLQQVDQVYSEKLIRAQKEDQLATLRSNLKSWAENPEDPEADAKWSEIHKTAKAQGLTANLNAEAFDLVMTQAKSTRNVALLDRLTSKRGNGVPSLADSVDGGTAKITEAVEAIDKLLLQDAREEEAKKGIEEKKVLEESYDKFKGMSVDELIEFSNNIEDSEALKDFDPTFKHQLANAAHNYRKEKLGLIDEEVREREKNMDRNRLLWGDEPSEEQLRNEVNQGRISPGYYHALMDERKAGFSGLANETIKDAMAEFTVRDEATGTKSMVTVAMIGPDGKPTQKAFERDEWTAIEADMADSLSRLTASGTLDPKNKADAAVKMRQNISTVLKKYGLHISTESGDLSKRQYSPVLTPQSIGNIRKDDWEGMTAIEKNSLISSPVWQAIKDPDTRRAVNTYRLKREGELKRGNEQLAVERAWINAEAQNPYEKQIASAFRKAQLAGAVETFTYTPEQFAKYIDKSTGNPKEPFRPVWLKFYERRYNERQAKLKAAENKGD